MTGRARPSRTTRRRVLAGVGVTGVAALSGCVAVARPDGRYDEAVSIAGSSTVYPVSKALAEEYFKAHPGAEITVSSTGTGAGFSNFFCPGMTDINDASRPIKPAEREFCAERGVTPIEFRVATDALSVIVNPENEWVDCLSLRDLQRIWGPDDPPQRWSDIDDGWPDEDLNLYGPTAASGTFDFFTETVMGEGGVSRADYQKTEQDNAIVSAVARDRFAMGYLGFAYYVESRSRLRGVPLSSEGTACTAPTFETAKTGAYPLSRPLFIYVAKEALAAEIVRDFVEFYLDRSRTDVIRRVGYVPVTDETAAENLETLRLAVREVTA